MFEDLLQLVDNYARLCFATSTKTGLKYHNLAHTEEVVSHAREMATFYGVGEKDNFCVLCAAWFHDLGYLYTSHDKHEERSAELMRAFAQVLCPTEIMDTIEKIILATKYPNVPRNLLQEIMRDADTYHFGTPEFFAHDRLVKEEIEIQNGKPVENWDKSSLSLLVSHQFYTSYCKQRLDAGKRANIKILESRLK